MCKFRCQAAGEGKLGNQAAGARLHPTGPAFSLLSFSGAVRQQARAPSSMRNRSSVSTCHWHWRAGGPSWASSSLDSSLPLCPGSGHSPQTLDVSSSLRSFLIHLRTELSPQTPKMLLDTWHSTSLWSYLRCGNWFFLRGPPLLWALLWSLTCHSPTHIPESQEAEVPGSPSTSPAQPDPPWLTNWSSCSKLSPASLAHRCPVLFSGHPVHHVKSLRLPQTS